MSASEVIKEAWSAVDEAGLPDDLKETAFREVLRSMLSGSEPVGKPRFNARNNSGNGSGGDGAGSNHGSGDGDTIDVNEAEVFAKVEHETGVSAEKLERIVMIDDGVIKMVKPGRELGKNTADAARAVAQVITVVGAYGLERRDTEYETIRTECDRLKVYDSKNFASKHLPNITGFVTKGSGSARRLEVKAQGRDNFAAVVDKLVGAA